MRKILPIILLLFVFLGAIPVHADRSCGVLIWNNTDEKIAYSIYAEVSPCCSVLYNRGIVQPKTYFLVPARFSPGLWYCSVVSKRGHQEFYFEVTEKDIERCRQSDEGEGAVLLLILEEEEGRSRVIRVFDDCGCD